MCQEKKCTKCGKVKPIEEFSFKNKAQGIRRSQCKQCIKEYDKNRYEENRNNCQEKLKENHKKQTDTLKQYVLQLKQQSKCTICGDSRWYVLDFHHTRDKKYSIAELVKRGCSIATLQKELEKCVPLCANCHREVHYKNGLRECSIDEERQLSGRALV